MSLKSILIQIHKDLVAGNIALPSLPQISLKIKKAAADPDIDMVKLSKIAEMDPAFCGYLLQICNSPIYRGSTKIDNVQLAIGRLGLENTRNIAMTYAVRSLFTYQQKSIESWLQKLWYNSTYTAAVACVIAERMQARFDPDEAALAGLLQDIGCLPLLDKAGAYPQLLDDEKALRWLFDRYAATVGSALLRHWGMQEKFVTVVKHRDDWQFDSRPELCLTHLILVAKWHTYLGQRQLASVPRLQSLPAFARLDLETALSAEQSLQFVTDAREKISETRRAFGA